MYLRYILVITYMFSANVQAIMTSFLMALEYLTLQLSSYNTSKSWWLSISWLNDVRSQKTWMHNVIATKQYCLLQVFVAVLLLAPCAAFVKRYPDLVNCQKYYLRIDNDFYPQTCPNSLNFDQYIEQCTLTADCNRQNIRRFVGDDCTLNEPSYYCTSSKTFTYCTHDGVKIMDNVQCRNGYRCPGAQPRTCLL
jgi:hypothetical protein